ncbi:MAG: putative Rossmann-fold nucleotide-binding protein [Verrucomicrobiales bacterium]|jgi:predicted Rossmann-fold nucleotide-binding protein
MNEIHEIDTLEDYIDRGRDLRGCVIQGLDLGRVHHSWNEARVEGAVFLGCEFRRKGLQAELIERGAMIFPRFRDLPYMPYRPTLYTREELGKGDLDRRIFDHFVAKGRSDADLFEALSQRLHDHAIDDALVDLLEGRSDGSGEKKRVVAIMGGHGTGRSDPYFEKVARIARELTRRGYFIASGGGPGMMEATNFGAYLAEVSDPQFDAALKSLRAAEVYTEPGYVEAAKRVVAQHPDGCASLAIPTWFYGHEPSNQFSTHIAKYFSNSIREDGLLAIAKHGVIFAPGSAGTVQEIFMDATQNHYGTFEHVSPMVFLGLDHYIRKTRLWPTIQLLAEGKQYQQLLAITDEVDEVVREISAYKLMPFA